MKSEVIAQRYAEGFFSFAKQHFSPEQILGELKGLKAVLRENSEFRRFLESPGILFSEKRKVIESGFNESLSLELKNFIFFLVRKKRVDLLPLIINYLRVKYSHQEALDALLQVSFPLDSELIKLIHEKLEVRFHHRLKMFVHLDPDLLGGMRVRVRNTVIDGSVRGALDILGERLRSVQVA